MTVRIVCDFHADPGLPRCGLLPWRQQEGRRLAHEDFSVHDELWDAACPDDVVEWLEDGEIFHEGSFVLCIGCFEERLGRQLTREDFKTPPRRRFGLSPSYRFRSRWKARRQ